MTYEITLADLQRQDTAVVTGHTTPEGIAAFLGRAYEDVMSTVSGQGLDVAGAPFGRYLPTADGGFDVEAGFPVSGPVDQERAVDDVEPGELPGGRVARTLHVGPWDGVHTAYDALLAWAVDHGYAPGGPAWESYLDGPEVAQPRTEVFLPLAADAQPVK